MDIHEYQAKTLLAEYGMPIAQGGLAYSPEQAVYRAKEIGGDVWVVKAQIHSGARGKAGGVKVCTSEDEVLAAANDMLGKLMASWFIVFTSKPGRQLIGKFTSPLFWIVRLNALCALHHLLVV